jgi:hypothetical protein
MWVTTIRLKNADIKRVETICTDIANMDTTFKFKIEGKMLFIESEDRDTAYRRGVIFVKKYLREWKLGFEVSHTNNTAGLI